MTNHDPRAALERARESVEEALGYPWLPDWARTLLESIAADLAFPASATQEQARGGVETALRAELGRMVGECPDCGGKGKTIRGEVGVYALPNPCPRCAPARALLAEGAGEPVIAVGCGAAFPDERRSLIRVLESTQAALVALGVRIDGQPAISVVHALCYALAAPDIPEAPHCCCGVDSTPGGPRCRRCGAGLCGECGAASAGEEANGG